MHLHTDDFWHYITSGGILPYLPESDEQNQVVMRVIQRAAFTYAEGGFTTIIDGIVGPWMMNHFLAFNEEGHAARLHYVVLRPARQETVRRAQGRTSPDALIDEEPVLSLWDQFSDLGDLETHVVDTTEHRPSTTLQAVKDAIASDRFRLSTSH